MMINPAQLDAAATRSAASHNLMDQGYAILRGAAPASLIARVAKDLRPRYDATPFCEGGFYGERTKRFGRLLIRSPHMADLVMNPAILDLAELALGNWCERIQLNLAQAIELHPGALAQFPHRDQDMWQGALGEVEYLVNVMWPLTPFIFEEDGGLDEEAFETCLWERLESLSRKDDWAGQPPDPRVSHSPEDPHFSLSFGGEAFFVVGLHPGASRPARRFERPALVFNLHDQFEKLRETNVYETMRGKIIARDVALAGTANPMLARHGDVSEARQYSGRAVGPDWRCPFSGRSAAP